MCGHECAIDSETDLTTQRHHPRRPASDSAGRELGEAGTSSPVRLADRAGDTEPAVDGWRDRLSQSSVQGADDGRVRAHSSAPLTCAVNSSSSIRSAPRSRAAKPGPRATSRRWTARSSSRPSAPDRRASGLIVPEPCLSSPEWPRCSTRPASSRYVPLLGPCADSQVLGKSA